MKKHLILAAILVASTRSLHAQAPASTPAVTSLASLTISPASASMVAQSAASQSVDQVNMLASRLTLLLTSGVPAVRGNPAASAYQVQQALGADNFAKLNAAIVALGGTAVPAATPLASP
jgi:hypothetical protein